MMNDVLAKIDTLIGMSKSTANYDTLKAELSDIQDEIENKKREIEDLRLSMQDEKYIKASDRIIDENIKVSLELKIQKLESNLKKAEKDLKKMVSDEAAAHQIVQNWKDKVAKITKLLMVLNEKISSSDSQIKEYYQNLIAENEKKLDIAKRNVTETEEEYRKTSRELTDFTSQVEKLKKELKEEKTKLASTIQSLESNDAYIDKFQKENDEKKLEDLKKRVEELKARQEEILRDPVYIGSLAKELYIEDDRTGCLLKVKELVEFLKTLPFMDIANSSDIDRILNEAEESLVAERDEFASMIENKKYDADDSQIIEERKRYLETKKQSFQEQLEKVKSEIKSIDLEKIKEINSLLSAAIIVENNLKKDLAQYNSVIEGEQENATPKKKAVLTAAFKKKEEELEIIEGIINDYENEMEELMLESKSLEESTVRELEEKIEYIDKLLKDISKKTMVTSKATDVLSLENDKAKLKELNNRIKEIAERRKYLETPSEIFDSIEMSLGSLSEEPIDEKIVEETETKDDFRITEDLSTPEETWNRTEKNKDILNDEPEIEIPPIEESFTVTMEEPEKELEDYVPEEPIAKVLEEPSVLDEPTITPIEEIQPEIPPIVEMNTPVTQRLKVINIEDLNPQTEKATDEISTDDVLIGDFKDDDYIDFDSIMGGAQ